jgi:argininosuccinate lyase
MDVLEAHALLLDARAEFLEVTKEHVHTLVPTYTHGVQAQRTTLAHFLLAFADTSVGNFCVSSAHARSSIFVIWARRPLSRAVFPFTGSFLRDCSPSMGAIENSYACCARESMRR